MDKKKILYVSAGLPVGGAEKFLISLANSLTGETAKQVVVSLSNNNQVQHEFDPSIDIHVFPRAGKYDTKPLADLRNLVATLKPDIIFCINFFPFAFVKLATFGLAGKRRIICSYQSTIHPTRREHLLHKMYVKMVGRKDFVIMTSRNQEKYTLQHYPIPASRFITITNGVDMNHWTTDAAGTAKKEIRAKHGIPESAKVIILAATFRPEKNHFGAIRALEIVHGTYGIKPYLLLVGAGPLFEEVKKAAAQSKVSAYIVFAGKQSDMRPYYWSSDIFTLTSNAIETFSFAAQEAMGCGLPCVMTDIGGASEMIEVGKTGYLCETSDAMIAEGWKKACETSFSKEYILAYARKNFDLNTMLNQYREELAIHTTATV